MAAGQRLPYALVRIAYGGHHSTQGIVTARRGGIGEDAGDKRSPVQGRLSGSCRTTRPSNFPSGGGSGDKRRKSRWRISTPTDRQIVAPQLGIPHLGTPNAKSRSRRGEAEGDRVDGDRFKGMEQPERLQGKIASISAAETP